MTSSQSLKQKTISAVLWNTAEKVLVKGASFIISIILARFLSPTDYGLIGMLVLFIALSTIFIESGFAKALIQNQNCSDIDYSTAFYANIGMAICIYGILFFAAPLVANFYSEPSLCKLLRVLSINFLLGSFNVVQRAKLMSKMDFKSLAKINFIGTFIGGAIGVLMAYTNWGVWALVGQTIASTLIMLLLLPYYSKWIPLCAFSYDSFRKLFGFGSKLLITGTVATIVNNISTIAIGKAYRSDQLGYYTRATQFSEMIAFTVNDILGTVTYPILSELQEKREQMVAVYRKSLLYTSLVIFPVMILMALLARPLVIILLTEKWLPCVFLFQILCLARMLTPLSAINMNVLNAIGRPDLFMRVDLCKVPIILVVLAMTIPIGVEAIVIGTFITTVISFFINAYYPGKLFGYGAWEQLKDYKKIFFAVLIMAVLVVIVGYLFENIWLHLIIGTFSGVGGYITCCFLLKIITYKEIKAIIHK